MDELASTDWSKVPEGITENDQRFAHDNKLHVQFYLRPVLLTTASEEANRPIITIGDVNGIMLAQTITGLSGLSILEDIIINANMIGIMIGNISD